MENADILMDESQKIYYKSSVRTWQNKYWQGVPVQNEPSIAIKGYFVDLWAIGKDF